MHFPYTSIPSMQISVEENKHGQGSYAIRGGGGGAHPPGINPYKCIYLLANERRKRDTVQSRFAISIYSWYVTQISLLNLFYHRQSLSN